jgi:hypothetical protein
MLIAVLKAGRATTANSASVRDMRATLEGIIKNSAGSTIRKLAPPTLDNS